MMTLRLETTRILYEIFKLLVLVEQASFQTMLRTMGGQESAKPTHMIWILQAATGSYGQSTQTIYSPNRFWWFVVI